MHGRHVTPGRRAENKQTNHHTPSVPTEKHIPRQTPGPKGCTLITEPTWVPRQESTTGNRQTQGANGQKGYCQVHTHITCVPCENLTRSECGRTLSHAKKRKDPGKRATECSLCYTHTTLERNSTWRETPRFKHDTKNQRTREHQTEVGTATGNQRHHRPATPKPSQCQREEEEPEPEHRGQGREDRAGGGTTAATQGRRQARH